MADEIQALLERVGDLALRNGLEAEIDRLRRKRDFGLVFESHIPERVRLPDYPIRRGTAVVFWDSLPSTSPMQVIRVEEGLVTAIDNDETVEAAANELVVVGEFGQPIYPGRERLASVRIADDKPAHRVIKGENFHVLSGVNLGPYWRGGGLQPESLSKGM